MFDTLLCSYNTLSAHYRNYRFFLEVCSRTMHFWMLVAVVTVHEKLWFVSRIHDATYIRVDSGVCVCVCLLIYGL